MLGFHLTRKLFQVHPYITLAQPTMDKFLDIAQVGLSQNMMLFLSVSLYTILTEARCGVTTIM